jgi:hypothetical protein
MRRLRKVFDNCKKDVIGMAADARRPLFRTWAPRDRLFDKPPVICHNGEADFLSNAAMAELAYAHV